MIDLSGYTSYRVNGRVLVSTDSLNLVFENSEKKDKVVLFSQGAPFYQCFELNVNGYLWAEESASVDIMSLNDEQVKIRNINK